MSLRRMLRDTSGASIVIALVFFLICGVVGSVVVTAASVEAKSVQTHQDMQQDEYTVQSAAELVAKQLSGSNVVISVAYSKDGVTPNVVEVKSKLGKAIWGDINTKGALDARAGGNPYAIGSTAAPIEIETKSTSTASAMRTVNGKITIDRDLNLTADLSLSATFAADSPYNMTVEIPCIPTYDISGKLVSFTYGDAVIEKA